jgi:hypothetical protein
MKSRERKTIRKVKNPKLTKFTRQTHGSGQETRMTS